RRTLDLGAGDRAPADRARRRRRSEGGARVDSVTPVLELSSSTLVRNVAAVRARIAPSELMLAMKDDAYGHGVEWVLDALRADTDVNRFGSYDVATGERIRALRPDGRVFAWATSPDGEIMRALDAGLELGIGGEDYLRRV